MMKTIIRLVIVLGLTSMVAAAALAEVYTYTQPRIARHRQEALERAIFTVLPGVTSYRDTAVAGRTIYAGYRDGALAGYAVPAAGGGFQGTIGLMCGLSAHADTMVGLTVLESVETPGLGDKITKGPFIRQFAGLNVAGDASYVKNRRPNTPLAPGQIDAITGATISSAAVTRIINGVLADIRPALTAEEVR